MLAIAIGIGSFWLSDRVDSHNDTVDSHTTIMQDMDH